MAQSPARRRLQRILDNETYGPKLTRLNKTDQRGILNLIEQNRMPEARRRILSMDEARRERNRIRDRVRRYLAKPMRQRSGSNRPLDEESFFWRLYDQAVEA
jgi:hypothetical protein